jgi:tetratricopeptide (TPR) repeat protein
MRYFLIIALLLFSASAAIAANDVTRPIPATVQAAPAQAPVVDPRMMLVRRAMSVGDYQSATAMLESIFESDTTDVVTINLLKTCYRQLKLYTKFEMLARRMIDRSPDDYVNYLDLAEALIEEGQIDSGLVAYHQATDHIKDQDPNKYYLVVRSEISHGLDSLAMLLIDSARTQLSKPSFCAIERAGIFERERRYSDAVSEYLPELLKDTTNEAIEAERRLMALLDFDQSSAEVEKLLLAQTKNGQSPRVVRLLSDFYIRSNRYDRAYQYAILRDSLESQDGSTLIYFMHQCADRKLYPQVVKMGEYLFSHRRKSTMISNAALVYGDALVHTGRISEARARYDTLFATSPAVQDKAEALYRIGMIYYDNLKDYPQALTYFDSVTTYFRRGLSSINAQRMIPYCYLRMGDRPAARKNFEFVKTQIQDQDVREEMAYQVALISFYDHQYDSSKAAFRKLMVDYPRGLYVNEAIRLVLAIDDAQGDTAALDNYSGALWCLERDRPDSARILLGLIASADGALADVALYQTVLLDLDLGDTAAVFTGIDQLTTAHPDSYYLPYVLRIKGELLAANPNRIEDAKAVFKQILEKYPDYPFTTEVRNKLRQLETDFKVG